MIIMIQQNGFDKIREKLLQGSILVSFFSENILSARSVEED